MRKYAIINDFIVTEICSIEVEQVPEASLHCQLIIDVEDLLIPPQAGWVLSGSQLAPPEGQAVPVQDTIKGIIRRFQKLAPELLVSLYTNNTLLGITASQSDAMFEEYQDVLIRLREGAWPTALYRLNQKQPSGFVTQEMIDGWKAMIISGMQS